MAEGQPEDAVRSPDEALIDQLVEEQQAGEPRSVYPVLLVGLGGTGAEVLRRVKARVTALGLRSAYRFLVLDMDEESRLPNKGGPGFEDDEFLYLPRARAVDVLQHPGRHPDLKERFDLDNADVCHFLLQQARSPYPGAGQIRPLGLLGFHASHEAFDEAVRKALAALNSRWRGLEERLERAAEGVRAQRKNYAVIVSSACGGTGSSCLIDVGASLRAHLERTGQFELNTLLTLPDVYDARLKGKSGQRAQVRANAYAVLREVDYFQTGGAKKDGVTLANGRGTQIPAPEKLFDTTYLIERVGADGADLVTAEAVYDTMALYLTAEIALTVGAKLASGAANDKMRHGTAKCPHSKRRRIYSTIGASAVSIPFRRLLMYCGYRKVHEYLDAHLKDSVELQEASKLKQDSASATGQDARGAVSGREAATVASDADAWLLEAGLEERGRDDLITRLEAAGLPAGFEGHLSSLYRGGGRSGKGHHPDRVFLKNLESLTSEWPRSTLGKIAQDFAAAGKTLRGEATESLRAKARAWSRERSARHAHDITQHLVSVFGSMKADMEKEVGEHEEGASLAKKSAGEVVRRTLAGFVGRFGTDGPSQTKVVVQLRAQFDHETKARAKKIAASIYGALASEAEKLAGQMDAAILTQCEALRLEMSQLVTGCLPTPGKTTTWTESRAEIDATTAEFFRQTYDAHPLPLGDFAEDFQAEAKLDDDRPLNGDLFRRRFRQALLRRALRHYLPRLRALDVSTLLEQMYAQGGVEARKAAARVEEALSACRPMWQAEIGKIDATFSDYIVLGAPRKTDSEVQAALHASIDTAKARLNDDPRYLAEAELVTTEDNHRIYAVRQSHGGLPSYMRNLPEWKSAYDSHQRGGEHPIHVLPRTIVEGMPRPDLVEEESRGERLFALGLAYGFVARRGNHYYLNVDRDESIPGFRTVAASHWDGVAYTERGDLRPKPGGLAAMRDAGTLVIGNKPRLEAERRLSDEKGGYVGALKRFQKDDGLWRLIQDAYDALCEAASRTTVAEDLKTYAKGLASRTAPGHVMYEPLARAATLIDREAKDLLDQAE